MIRAQGTKHYGDRGRGKDDIGSRSSTEEIHDGGEVRANLGRNRIYVAAETLEELGLLSTGCLCSMMFFHV
jgi:hypothetical protein